MNVPWAMSLDGKNQIVLAFSPLIFIYDITLLHCYHQNIKSKHCV